MNLFSKDHLQVETVKSLLVCSNLYYKTTQKSNKYKHPKGPFTPSVSINAAVTFSVMTLAILFSLKSMETLENELQPHSGVSSQN